MRYALTAGRPRLPRSALMPMTALVAGMVLLRVGLFRRMTVAVLEDYDAPENYDRRSMPDRP